MDSNSFLNLREFSCNFMRKGYKPGWVFLSFMALEIFSYFWKVTNKQNTKQKTYNSSFFLPSALSLTFTLSFSLFLSCSKWILPLEVSQCSFALELQFVNFKSCHSLSPFPPTHPLRAELLPSFSYCSRCFSSEYLLVI